jgi:hypothetical protein
MHEVLARAARGAEVGALERPCENSPSRPFIGNTEEAGEPPSLSLSA